MLLSHIKRLCSILPSLITASNTGSNASISNSLPVQLQSNVPACAQPCLQAALEEQFSLSCTDISCLCSRYSNTGDSLGEVALRCIYTSCPTTDKASSAYNVCLGEKNAVRPTLTALTVAATMSSSQSTTITKSTPTPTFTTSIRTLTPSTTASVNSDPFVSSTSSSVIPTATSSAIAAVSGTTAGRKAMTPAQIAGLSVAAVATFIVAIGLMAFSVFLRKRRERQEIVEISEKKTQPFPPSDSSLPMPPEWFPTIPELSAQKSSESLRGAFRKTPNSNPASGQAKPDTAAYAVPPTSSPPKTYTPDFSALHPLLRPGASRNSSNFSVPSDQIGLAISAELPGKSVKPQSPQPPREAELRQQRPKSLRRSLGMNNRASRASVLTVFEEDVLPARRRSSKLLSTPPVPIAPIRALQPSRPPPTFNPIGKPVHSSPVRKQIRQQPELFLNVPVRHSRLSPPRITPIEAPSRGSPKYIPQLASPIDIASTYSAYKPTITAASTPETSNIEDITDYYFTSHQKPAKSHPPSSSSSPGHSLRPKDSPKVVLIKPKTSASTVSRATSRASTSIRDSISSQTSFETTGTNNATPDDEDDDKQLSDDNTRLSPVAESPISNLRYPKVPRTSNQLVPRSPRSPQSYKGRSHNQKLAQIHGDSNGSPRLPSPSALLVKRRGEREALQLESELHMASPNRTDLRDYMKHYRQHMRSNSAVESWKAGLTGSTERTSRAQSGQWPKSPAMFDVDAAVKPLNIRAKKQSGVNEGQLMSPMWVPHLTPTRQGEDLLLSVSYSKDGR